MRQALRFTTLAVVVVVAIDTTAIISAGFSASEQQKEKQESARAALLFVGDIMLDRHIRKAARQNGGYTHTFAGVKDLFAAHDAVIGNLEGPITELPSVSVGSIVGTADNMTFTAPPEAARALAAHNVRALHLGNNHMLDFGTEGVRQTREYLRKEGIAHWGDPVAQERHAVVEVRGVSVGLVSFNEIANDDTAAVRHAIAGLNGRVDFLVVYAHWGEEYAAVPSKGVQDIAHAFIESGADLVVGTHPHVIQPMEQYRGGVIYYSLGNFVFDQYQSKETMEGMAVSVTLTSGGVAPRYRAYRVSMQPNGTTIPLDFAAEPRGNFAESTRVH